MLSSQRKQQETMFQSLAGLGLHILQEVRKNILLHAVQMLFRNV